jgi:hypothetical protein
LYCCGSNQRNPRRIRVTVRKLNWGLTAMSCFESYSECVAASPGSRDGFEVDLFDIFGMVNESMCFQLARPSPVVANFHSRTWWSTTLYATPDFEWIFHSFRLVSPVIQHVSDVGCYVYCCFPCAAGDVAHKSGGSWICDCCLCPNFMQWACTR